MSAQNTQPKVENHIILALVLFASTFMNWVDSFGGGTNLWEIAGNLWQMGRFSRSGEAMGIACVFYAFPVISGLILLSALQGGQHRSRALSGFGGFILGLIFIGLLVEAGDSKKQLGGFGAFVEPGMGFFLAGAMSVLLVLNFFGLVTVSLGKFIGKLFSGKPQSPQTAQTNLSSSSMPSADHGVPAQPDVASSNPVSVPSVKMAQASQVASQAAQKSLNIVLLGAEEFKNLVEKHGFKSFLGGLGLGVMGVYQPWLAGLALGGAVTACGMKSKQDPESPAKSDESSAPPPQV